MDLSWLYFAMTFPLLFGMILRAGYLMNLDVRTLNNGVSYGEIEKIDEFDLNLRRLYFLGLAEKLDKEKSENRNGLVWRGETWVLASEAFAWWIRDTIITKTHKNPSIDDWISNHRYTNLLSLKTWDTLSSVAAKMPSWALQGTFGLVRSLLEELRKNA